MKKFKLSCLGILTILTFAFASSSIAFDVIVPDTGQDLCYNGDKIMCDSWHMEGDNQVCDSPPYCPQEGQDFYGQDAQYTINPPSLTDNLNGTVTDNLTGFMWEQKTAANEPNLYTYAAAFQYCEDLTLAGHSDWRLPSIKEYTNLFNMGRVSPALDTAYFPYYTSNLVVYWTSSSYYNNINQNWTAQIAFGMFGIRDKTKKAKAQCVRGAAEPAQSYTNYGNGTVVDNLTGLMWEQKTDDGGSRDKDNTYTWNDAFAYCENLVLGDHSDWRIPNPKELERLVDLSKSSPAINTAYFPNTNNGFYWTGTTCSGCHKMKAFAVDFTDGLLSGATKYDGDIYYENYVRCVRNAEPTVIALSSFTANSKTNKVILQWVTASEINNAGFNLYRAESEKGKYIKINTSLIPTQGSSTKGASYEFVDTYVQNRKTYYYKLEDLDLNGTSTMHGPASATPRLIYWMGK